MLNTNNEYILSILIIIIPFVLCMFTVLPRNSKTMIWLVIPLIISIPNCWIWLTAIPLLLSLKKIPEPIITMVINILGILWMLFAEDLISLYLSIELQSLSLVLLISYYSSKKGLEASIKYFFLASISSAIMLLGLIWLSLETNSISWNGIYWTKDISWKLITLGIMFKLGAVPFSNWIPEVYQGSKKWIAAYISTIPKIGIVLWLLKNWNILLDMTNSMWLSLIIVLTSLIGSLGGLNQNLIARLLGYSSIANASMFILLLNSGIKEWFEGFSYIWIYSSTLLCIWTLIKMLPINSISQIPGIYKRYKQVGNLVILLFSLAGVPPLIGFIMKYTVIYATLGGTEWILILIVLMTSVISSYYYLRIIQLMLFQVTLNEKLQSLSWVWSKDTKDINICYLQNILTLVLLLIPIL